MSDLPYYSYSIYGEGHSIEAAAQWIEDLLLGQLGTTIAVLAVAIAGLNMLWGRISAREGIRILLGCFVLFGAPAIAQGLMSAIDSGSSAILFPPPQAPASAPRVSATPLPPANINPFDPYTGAAPAN